MRHDLLSFGNRKLPKTTAVFNMGPAMQCPAARAGLCRIEPGKCYCLKAERMYAECAAYRMRQAEYWKNTPLINRIHDCAETLEKKRKPVTAFRFNVSGDFGSLRDISDIAEIAGNFSNIRFYAYTARTDLMQKIEPGTLPENLTILISNAHVPGFDTFTAVHGFTNKRGVVQCKGNCRICNICTIRKPAPVKA